MQIVTGLDNHANPGSETAAEIEVEHVVDSSEDESDHDDGHTPAQLPDEPFLRVFADVQKVDGG
eukprot:11971585-Karenia_brevis.AAC.1